MAKLYFSYSAMNAGKSTLLLQASYNYGERGMKTILFTAKLDNRSKLGEITSRIGLAEKAQTFEEQDNLFKIIENKVSDYSISCILIDEAQFLTQKQVWELSDVVDKLNIPVIGLADSNVNPDYVDIVIPGNDDAIRSIELIASSIADSCLKGLGKRKEVTEKKDTE